MAGGLVSMRYGFKGPNFAPVSACASSAHAIGESYRMIMDGMADAMVTGGSEACVTGLTIAAFSNMKAMSTRNDDPDHRQPPVRQGPGRLRAGRWRRVPHPREPRARREAWRRDPRRGLRLRPLGRRLPHVGTGARGRGRPARHAHVPRERQDRPDRRRLRQRARHLDAAGRHRRDPGGQGGVRRSRPEADLRLHQVDDRAPARRRRRPRVRRRRCSR